MRLKNVLVSQMSLLVMLPLHFLISLSCFQIAATYIRSFATVL